MASKKQKNTECKLCKSAHPFCDECCDKCKNTCNTQQVCRLEPAKIHENGSFTVMGMNKHNGGVMAMECIEINYELTVNEKTRLDELCGIVDRGIKSFFEVGTALAEIRDTRLYRETHETFEDFCYDRWDIARRHAYRLIDGAFVVKNVSHGTQDNLAPLNERQARPLTEFEADVQRDLWQIVLDRANENNGRITATLVSSVVADYLRKSHQEKMKDTKERVSRETLIEPRFKETFQVFIDVVSDTINTGFKGTSREAVLRHIDAVRELVANTK